MLSIFYYCPIVWRFCGKVNKTKIEKIHERALCFMFNDKKSSYSSLLEKKCLYHSSYETYTNYSNRGF